MYTYENPGPGPGPVGPVGWRRSPFQRRFYFFGVLVVSHATVNDNKPSVNALFCCWAEPQLFSGPFFSFKCLQHQKSSRTDLYCYSTLLLSLLVLVNEGVLKDLRLEPESRNCDLCGQLHVLACGEEASHWRPCSGRKREDGIWWVLTFGTLTWILDGLQQAGAEALWTYLG